MKKLGRRKARYGLTHTERVIEEEYSAKKNNNQAEQNREQIFSNFGHILSYVDLDPTYGLQTVTGNSK